MIKRYLFTLLFTAACLNVPAQSQTFKIEDISKPIKLLPKVTSDDLFKNVDKDFVKLSVTDSIVQMGTHTVLNGYLNAYQNHYPLTFSPDIAWLLICQGFANHINQDPEKFRSRLAGFDGKKTLNVVRDLSGVKDLSAIQWETIFPEFASQIAEFTGKELIGNLSADFTTSTPSSLVSSQITIMESVKEFFNYKVTFIGCGISEVTVEGTVKDWEKILKRLDYLEGYDLKWWTSELKPVIKKIIDTKKGKVDKQFWMNMVKYHKLGYYGSYDGVDGWLLKFYPYLVTPYPPEISGLPDTSAAKRNYRFVSTASNPIEENYKIRSTFKEIKGVGVLPTEVVNVPFVVELQDRSGHVAQSYKMEFWAGFMGLKQDPVTFNVKPEIGWAVNRKAEMK